MVRPVPPDVAPSVPANVTAPVVDDDGVRPLKDVWNDVTPVAGAGDQAGRPADMVRMYPFVPAANLASVVAPVA